MIKCVLCIEETKYFSICMTHDCHNGITMIWIEDQINDPECPARHSPKDMIGVSDVITACRNQKHTCLYVER